MSTMLLEDVMRLTAFPADRLVVEKDATFEARTYVSCFDNRKVVDEMAARITACLARGGIDATILALESRWVPWSEGAYIVVRFRAERRWRNDERVRREGA
jgi:hypothetical protein